MGPLKNVIQATRQHIRTISSTERSKNEFQQSQPRFTDLRGIEFVQPFGAARAPVSGQHIGFKHTDTDKDGLSKG
ncbi:hypothetical protein B9Z51_05700 [Limnohabitans sp. T6-5]|nr:hypothetical protein B9Z51_05700 [Limnohabitans sp. T6-5]